MAKNIYITKHYDGWKIKRVAPIVRPLYSDVTTV